jgi:hypothetical protein
VMVLQLRQPGQQGADDDQDELRNKYYKFLSMVRDHKNCPQGLSKPKI